MFFSYNFRFNDFWTFYLSFCHFSLKVFLHIWNNLAVSISIKISLLFPFPFRCHSKFRRRHHLLHHKCSDGTTTNKPPPTPTDTTTVVDGSEDLHSLRRRLPVAAPLVTLPLHVALPEQTEPEDLSMSTGLHSHSSGGDDSPPPSSGGDESGDEDGFESEEETDYFLHRKKKEERERS